MSNTDILARLARACAHGTRQMEFVNELLAGEGYSRSEDNPWAYNGKFVTYGDARLSHKSWISVRKRLTANGFMVKISDIDKNGVRKLKLEFSV